MISYYDIVLSTVSIAEEYTGYLESNVQEDTFFYSHKKMGKTVDLAYPAGCFCDKPTLQVQSTMS